MKKQQEKSRKVYQRFYDMPVICPCCGKDLYLTTTTRYEVVKGFDFDYDCSVCSKCGSQIYESVDVLRRNQADLKFAYWEQKKKNKRNTKRVF